VKERVVTFIKEMIRTRTLVEIMAAELREAQLRKLEAETAAEYAKSVVQYNEQRIKRLEQRIMDHMQDGRVIEQEQKGQ
jgi:hypothetical protein